MKSPVLYLLDTSTFFDIANGRSLAARKAMDRLIATSTIAISTITEAEVLFGLARKPLATRLRAETLELFSVMTIFPWDSEAARAYATLRVLMAAQGKSLTAKDTLIAAHAFATGATLVTRDSAFAQIEALPPVVNWATDLCPTHHATQLAAGPWTTASPSRQS